MSFLLIFKNYLLIMVVKMTMIYRLNDYMFGDVFF